MEYEIIGVDEYGSFAKNVKNEAVCHKCKYFNYHKHAAPCRSCLEVYYYPTNLEAAKLESEITPETFTINDMYVESKLLFDCQDKLNDLQLENKKLKDRIKMLEVCQHPYKYLERNENGLFCQKCKTQISSDPNIY